MLGLDDPKTYPRLAVAPDGRALLAWSSVAGDVFECSYSVRYAEAAPGDGFAGPYTVARDGTIGSVALSEGHALIGFVSGPREWVAIDGRRELVADHEPLPTPPWWASAGDE